MVSVVSVPLLGSTLPLRSGGPFAPGAGGGGFGMSTGQTGGSIGAAFQSTLTSPNARP